MPTGDDKVTTELAPVEIEALLHDASSGEIEASAETIEMVPLVALDDLEPPDPVRTARGTDPVTPSRPRRTVERLAIADIIKRK